VFDVETSEENSGTAEKELVHRIMKDLAPGAVIHPFVTVGSFEDWPALDVSKFKDKERKTESVWMTSSEDEERDQGLFYHLGTKGGTQPYVSPACEGADPDVDVKMSSVEKESNPPSALLNETYDSVSTESKPNSYVLITLKNGHHIIPSGYSIVVDEGNQPRSWRLEGSNDGSLWRLLKEHNKELGFTPFSPAREEMRGSDGKDAKMLRGAWHFKDDRKWVGYNRLRLMATGTDQSKRWGWHGLRSLEFFGVVGGKELREIPKPKATNRMAVVQLLNSDPNHLQDVVKALNHAKIDTLLNGAQNKTVCVPRVVDLCAYPLHQVELPLRKAALNQFYQDQLFEGEENPSSRLSAVLDDILQIHANKDGKQAVTLPNVNKMLRTLKDVPQNMQAQADLTPDGIKKHILSQSAPSIIEWLDHQGYDLNLCRARFLNLQEALGSMGSLRYENWSRVIGYLMHLSHQVGQPSLFDLTPSQLVDHGLPACDELSRLGFKSPTAPHNMAAVRLAFLLLKRLNLLFLDLYPLLTHEASMVELIQNTSAFIFPSAKTELLTKILDFTAEEKSVRLSVSVDRMSAALSGDQDAELGFENSIFANAFRQLRSTPPSRFRVARPSGAAPHLAFRIVTENEQVVGEAGPYRQFFTDISKELLAPNSTLFIPSPNQRHNTGEHRDKFVLNPKAGSFSESLEMLRFLGKLFGVCIRTGVKMMLYCPPLVWKILAGERVTRNDLRDVDRGTTEVLSLFEDLDEKTFTQTFSQEAQNFTIRLSDDTIKSLKPNGASTIVRWENRLEYVQLSLQARIQEQSLLLNRVRDGLEEIVPLQALHLMTWADLERHVCGRPDIDVEMLKRHTRYSGVNANAPHIKMFWRLLRKCSQETLRNLIRFCWGQDRLPATDKDFESTHTRFLIKSSTYKHPDQALPRADTCFFNLELPAYSSEDIMREKLLYAINTAITMNADQNQEHIPGGRGL